MTSAGIQLLPPNHSLVQRVNDYMRPFHTASCQEHLIGALQQLPKSPTFPREESSIREQVAIRLLQEVIVMGAQEQEALDACLYACGPLEALSACATTLQDIAAKNQHSSKSKKKKKKKGINGSSVESPSILETALRTIRRWLVKGVSFPPEHDASNSNEERCWVEHVTSTMSATKSRLSHYTFNKNSNDNHYHHQDTTTSPKDINSPLVQACLENLTKLVLLFPVQIANACHALGVQLPSWAIASRYNPRLIEGALSMALYQLEIEDASYSAQYFKILVQHMVRSRSPDDVALGLYKYHERHYRADATTSNINNGATTATSQPKVLCHLLLQLHRHTLSPRESAYLLRSIMISSIPRQSHATNIATSQLTDLWQRHLYPYMELSCRPILVASRHVREAFVRLLVLSPSSVLTEEWPDRLLCHCVASLLANPMPLDSTKKSHKSDKTRSTADSDSSASSSATGSSDDDSSNDDSDSDSSDDSGRKTHKDEAVQHHAWLAKHVQEVIATWSLAVFVRQTDHRLQRHVTNFLLSGMCFLQLQHDQSNSIVGGTGTSNRDPLTSDLVAGLLEGVTVRLESSIPAIRKDGMMIAERLAQKMGQELQFEELEQERTLADDDEVTFLQSVMTASEFPSHYYSAGAKSGPTPDKTSRAVDFQSRLMQQQRQEAIQPQHREEWHQRQHKPSKKEKKQKNRDKDKEKEERRKRRKAKREGKSDTRILDAVYGHVKSSSKQKSKHASCHDSYEDSYDDFYRNNQSQVSEDKPAVATSYHAPRSNLHHQLPRDQQRASRVSRGPVGERDRQKYDSYDNSSTQENHIYRAPILEKPRQSLAPLAESTQFAHTKSISPPQEHGFPHRQQQWQQQPSTQQSYGNPQSLLYPDQDIPVQSPNYVSPHQQQGQYHTQESTIQTESFGRIQQPGLHNQLQSQDPLYSEYPDEPSQDDGDQHVTWASREYVIPEKEDVQQELYWQNQLKQQRRQQHYQQQRAVERQLEKQKQQQQKWKEEERERQHRATLRIASPDCSSYQSMTQPKSSEAQPYVISVEEGGEHPRSPRSPRSPRRRSPKDVGSTIDGDARHDEFQEYYDEAEGGGEGKEDDGAHFKPVAEEIACWTKQEVEMVIDLPQLAPSSPTRRARSTRHTASPRHSASSPRHSSSSSRHSPAPSGRGQKGMMDLRRKPSSPRKTSDYDSKVREAPSSGSERDKDVPSLIFAMVDDDDYAGQNEESGENVEVTRSSKRTEHLSPRNLRKEKDTQKRKEVEEPIKDTTAKKEQSHSIPHGKPPLSPKSPYGNGFDQKPKLQKQRAPSLPSTQTSKQKESLTTSVRSRRHPQVDPAEIDARILAAAYDHESVASSKSAPSLSVYSSNSSEFSLYLGDEKGRNEASQRATRSPKQAFTTAFEHMKKKKQQRRNQEGLSKPRSAIILDGRTPKSPNKRVLMVDPDAAYVSDEDEDEEEDGDDDEYDDDDCSRSTDDDDDDDDDDEDDDDDDDEDDEEEYEEEYSDEGSYTDNEDEYDDDDSAWDDSEHRHLNAYDLEDDEEDLVETPRPRYLRDCLQLLRASESDKQAYSKHEAALKWLPRIIQGDQKPADLPDLAVSLALELMRMENKFNIENFEDDKLISAIALTVAEPLAVGQRLILLLWEDVAFMDRLDALTVLSEAAFELSGNKELEEWHKTAAKNAKNNEDVTQGKRAYVKENYSLLSCKDASTMTGTDMGSIVSAHAERALGHVESKTRRWGRGRRSQETPSFRSRFGPVAHVWYYSLVGGFLQRKDNPALWGGAIGARLLANLFVTLATIVECSGVAPGTDVLAKDLFELVWSFRTVDVAEVRMGVLVAVAASLSCLSEEVVLTMMFDGSLSSLPEGLKQMAQLDPDENCRRLAQSMARGLSGIVDSLQPVGKISKLSLSI